MRGLVLMVVGVGGMAVAGCASDSHAASHRNDAAPVLVPGGGISGEPIAQVLHIHVIDGESDAPISGAHVRLDPGTDAPLELDTSGGGLATFDDAALKGPQNATVTMSGYVTTTWVGIDGVNATITMQRERTTAPGPVATATARGTIEGWDELPEPAARHYRVALVGYSLTQELGDPENEIEQPRNAMGDALNVCFAIPGYRGCDWQMNTRTGAQAHYAVIIEGEQVGAEIDPSRDRLEVVGFALHTGVDAAEGEAITGESLKRIDADGMIDFQVTFDDPPSSLMTSGAFPLLVLPGGEGQIPFVFLPLTETSTTARVPALSGDLAEAQYDVFARAVPAPMVESPSTTFVDRDVDPTGVVRIGPWLAPPSNLSMAAGTLSFTSDEATNLHVAWVGDTSGAAWTFALLDGSTSFTLPVLAEDPLPAGELTMYVGAFEIDGFDPTEIRFEDGLVPVAVRFAEASGRVAR